MWNGANLQRTSIYVGWLLLLTVVDRCPFNGYKELVIAPHDTNPTLGCYYELTVSALNVLLHQFRKATQG